MAMTAEGLVQDRDFFADLVAHVASRRDQGAFARLFDHFAPRIRAYLLRIGTDNGTAEEITQEVMVTLWRKADLFDRTKSSVGTWLFRIARNRKIDLIRRDKSDTLDANDPMLVPEEDRPLEDGLDARRFETLVRAAMESLPREQFDLVNLAFFEGLSHSQIADVTGLPLGTVKSRIRLAFARLKKALEEKGITGDFS
jgi:RNA polymerase sigma factor (sigma-70 family)